MSNNYSIFFGLLLFSSSSSALQLEYSKELVDGIYQFNYQWKDHNNKIQTLGFSLSQKAVYDRYRNFSIYQPELAQEYVNKSLRKHFKKSPIKGVQVSFKEENKGFQAIIKSTNEQLLNDVSNQISLLEQGFTEEYLKKKYYHHFTTPEQVSAIKPDHGRIALESVNDLKALKPLILEKSSIKNIRKVSNYILSFIQNIPYSTLESRVTSSGVGFNPPLKLLWENKGDCDSKVTLTASLLRTLMPRIKLAFIYIENHALIGINVTPKSDDVTVIDNGITYVLAEPTGPAIFALGKLAKESERAIYNGHYTLERFHARNKPKSTEQEIEQTKEEELRLNEDENNSIGEL